MKKALLFAFIAAEIISAGHYAQAGEIAQTGLSCFMAWMCFDAFKSVKKKEDE